MAYARELLFTRDGFFSSIITDAAFSGGDQSSPPLFTIHRNGKELTLYDGDGRQGGKPVLEGRVKRAFSSKSIFWSLDGSNPVDMQRGEGLSIFSKSVASLSLDFKLLPFLTTWDTAKITRFHASWWSKLYMEMR
jgi:hypothetical protein